MSAQIKGVESLQCEYVVPDNDTPQLPRWSDTHIQRPALIVTPKTEQDVKDAIRVAKENKLTIVAAGGGHGTFVSVDSASLYLDMKFFKKIELNKDQGRVKVGGGVLAGEVLKNLAEEGYYTPIPNSDAVGFVGSMLGGGNSAQIGRHGWMVDNMVSFRLVTASGDVVEVDSSSKDKEQDLFNVLCGAGHGLGVVTELTVSAFPLSSLDMEDNKIWTRSLIFPVPALDVAIKTFLDLSHPPAEGYMSLAFARSPPGAPAAGSPIIILGYQYFGPAEQAEKATVLLFHDDIVRKTVVANTELLPFENVNAKMNIYNSHHGHKTIASCRLHKTTAEAVKAGFEKWRIATEDYPDAQQSGLIISAYNIDRTSAIKNEKFVEGRDRNVNAFMVMVAKEDKTREAFGPILDDVVASFRKSDEGMVPRSFPNNLRPGKDLSDMYDTERLEVLRDVKGTWDAEGVFWSPYFKTVELGLPDLFPGNLMVAQN
ncbi:6-hydroxy-D-nicotine oxidase [Fusarium agapanthi]|uniref:6-hydroxy-D-nicotine oxidase n=1 Tax=Fusarium agapanthi TaxID=1803897 RepID=A0A9P5BK28_9HYPO|nr:6-hydroxy-D-nicotine oxidase [Fusarium agapanthi]